MTDKHIQSLERGFPALSAKAFASARDRVLSSGQSVLQSSAGTIYQVFPDGHRVVVKQIDPPIRVKVGKTIAIR